MNTLALCVLARLVLGAQGAPSISQNTLDTRCWSNGNGNDQPRWFDEGSEIIKGSYYYSCEDGDLAAKGCIGPIGQRVLLGAFYVDTGFQFKCNKDSQGYLRFEPSACVDETQQIRMPGDTWESSNPTTTPYWYECRMTTLWDRPYLSIKTRGCLIKGKRMEAGETTHNDENWLECQDRHDGTAVLNLKGCYHAGQEHQFGDNWEEANYVYECRKVGDHASTVTCIGCMHGDRRLKSGDRYFKDDTVITCEILYYPGQNKTSKNHKVVGCLEKSRDGGQVLGERNIGCQWFHDDGNHRYEYICNPQGRVNTVGCTLLKDGFEHLFVPPNSYTIYQERNDNSTGIGCKDVDGQLQLFKFAPEDLIYKAQGLQYVEPRGKK